MKRSLECRTKMSQSKIGDINPMWRGDDVGLRSLHRWVRKRLDKPMLCPNCNTRPSYDLANITGIYNRELENWQYLCRKCHMESDGRINNLKQYTPNAHVFIERPRDELGRWV